MSTVRISGLTPYPGELQDVGAIALDDGANAYQVSPAQMAGYALNKAVLSGINRTVQQKLADTVSIMDFGAKADGVTDDAAALQAAIDTGRSVILPPGRSYYLANTVTVRTSRQFISAYGARIIAVGNNPMAVFTGPISGGGWMGGFIEASGKTADFLIRSSRASRMLVVDLVVTDPWNLLYIDTANYFEVRNVWCNNVRGTIGIHWYGDDTKRSDLLRLTGVTMSSPTARATGLLWEGNCHSVQAHSLNLVVMGYGVRMIRNSGAGQPFFFMGNDVEIDFPQFDGISVEAGGHVYLTPALYIHGSATGSGIKVTGNVQADTVTVTGGKITGHARYGLETASRIMESNIHFSGNALGDYGGTQGTVTKGRRFQVDPQAYFSYGNGNPLIAFDDADYVQFSRANNRYTMVVGGKEVLGGGVTSGLGYVQSDRFSLDATGYWTMSGGANPTLAFDANDYIQYNRATDRMNVVVGATEILGATNDRLSAAVPVVLRGYAFASLPSASAVPGGTVRVIDRSQRLATSDGINWRFTDGTIAT